MLKQTGFATLLSLTLMAGCAADTGSFARSLDTSEVGDDEQRCSRVLGEYDDTDVSPPPISIPIGDTEVSVLDAFADARGNPSDVRAGLLAEFATAQINIDGGAAIDQFDVDLLVSAEEFLALTDNESGLQPEAEADAAELISELDALNEGMRLDFPCLQNADATVLEVDVAPSPPERPARPTERRDKGRFLGTASADAPVLPSAPPRVGSKR